MEKKVIEGDSVKKNFIYQFLYQFVILVIPFVISPYLTRTLGSRALGVYTFTYSIAYYFVMFAMLGILRHGQRIVAERTANVVELRKTVWSLIILHTLISVVVLGIYMAYAFWVCKDNQAVAIAQGVYVFSAVIDLTWFFQGLEKFKTVVIRNTIIRLAECILIFSLVKKPDDLLVYTVIMSLSVCLGHIVMIPQVIRMVKPIKFSYKDVVEHIKPMLVLFVAAVAVSLYTVFDKTLLGILSDMDNVAFYEYSNKIITIPKTFITIISTILFPKACKLLSSGDAEGVERNLENSLMINYFIGFASVWGLLGIGELFAIVYYGLPFAECGTVIMSMAPLILIVGLGEVLRSLYLYPLKKDKTMVMILFINAAINLTLSIVLIPSMGVYGAVIGTIVAELFGLVYEMVLCRNYIKISKFLKAGIPFCVIGFIMFVVIMGITLVTERNIWGLLIQTMAGATVYVLLALIYCYRTNVTMKGILQSIFTKIKNVMSRK